MFQDFYVDLGSTFQGQQKNLKWNSLFFIADVETFSDTGYNSFRHKNFPSYFQVKLISSSDNFFKTLLFQTFF